MKCKLITLIGIFALTFTFSHQVSSQTTASKAATLTILSKVDSLFLGNKVLRFKFQAQSKEQINTYLTNIISIENVTPNLLVTASAKKSQFQQFLLANIPYEVIHPLTNKTLMTMATTVAQMATWDRYPTYDVYQQMMANFQTNYPTLCRIDTILATTGGGHRIIVAKITSNVNASSTKPQFLYTSTIHGDEITGYVMMIRLIDYLLSNYSSNTFVANLVNNVEIWICPSANPDGTYAQDNNSVGDSPYSTRENFNTMDLNRNYPDPRTGDPVSPYGPIQPETYAFMAFADLHHFTMSANFHGGSEVFNYPFDTWVSTSKTHADDNWFSYLGNQFVDSARIGLSTYYTSVNSSGVTEGGDWYVITGGRQDYMNWFKQCREVTIEISNDKTLTASLLPNYWNYNYKSFLNFIQQSTYGIRGIVTDSLTGQPIKALVWVNSHDRDSSHVYSIMPNGDYHRPIYAGTYSVTYSAPCYAPKTINNVVVTNNNTVTLNVQLVPGITADFTADTTTVSCNGNVAFTNLAYGASNYHWDFGDGTQSTLANPTHLYTSNGNFSVKLVISGTCGSDSITRTGYIHVNFSNPPIAINDTICNSGSASLTATGSGQLNWYSTAVGGTALDTGTVFHTPTISTTTTYYVESQTPPASQYVGKLDNTGGGANSTALQGLVFNCYSAVKLVSVKVYATGAGNRTIQLRDSNSTVIQTTTVNIPDGESRVTLNFNIPIGTKLQLAISGATINLYRNNAGVTYPFTISNVISIFSTTAATNPTTYYYYFYNWEIQGAPCKSLRTSAQAVVNYSTAPSIGTITQPTCSFATGSVVLFGLPISGSWTLTQMPGNIQTTGTGSSTVINGLAAGTYTFTVTNASACTSVASTNVVINAQPITPSAPTIGTTTQPTCAIATGSVILIGLPATGTWTLTRNPGGILTTGNGISTTISGLSAGTYSFVVTNASTCTSVSSANIVINTQPQTPNISNQTTSILTGTTFNVTPTGVPSGTTYTWTNPVYTGGVTGGSSGSGTSISGTLTILSGSGTATYTVTPSSGTCVGANFSVTVTVTTTCIPVTIGTQALDTIMCSSGNAAFNLLANGTAPFVYQWQYNNAGTWNAVNNNSPAGAIYTNGTNYNLSVSGIAATGSFQYRCNITNCSAANNATSNVVTLTVNPTPTTPTIGTITQPNCATATGSVVLSGLPSTGTWTLTRIPGGTITTGTGSTTTISGLPVGTYTYTVSNTSNCSSAASANIVINQQPTTPTAPTIGTITPTICNQAIGSVFLYNLPSAGNWIITQFPGGDTLQGTGTSTTFSGLTAGTYTFTITNSSACTSVSSSNVVVVAQPPQPTTPTITKNGLTLHSDATTGNQWYNQNGIITGATNQDYTVTVNGDYFDIVTISACSSDTSNIIHVIDAGIDFISTNNTINIYPNPAENYFIIDLGSFTAETTTIKIADILGQIIYQTNNKSKETKLQINNLFKGIYLIEVSTPTQKLLKKVVIR
ncbi:MAG: M14 family zinc carboxypeptidase [Bacteroidota bacterium]